MKHCFKTSSTNHTTFHRAPLYISIFSQSIKKKNNKIPSIKPHKKPPPSLTLKKELLQLRYSPNKPTLRKQITLSTLLSLYIHTHTHTFIHRAKRPHSRPFIAILEGMQLTRSLARSHTSSGRCAISMSPGLPTARGLEGLALSRLDPDRARAHTHSRTSQGLFCSMQQDIIPRMREPRVCVLFRWRRVCVWGLWKCGYKRANVGRCGIGRMLRSEFQRIGSWDILCVFARRVWLVNLCRGLGVVLLLIGCLFAYFRRFWNICDV